MEEMKQFSVLIYHTGALDLGVPNYEPEKGWEIAGVYTHKHESGEMEINAVVKKKDSQLVSTCNL